VVVGPALLRRRSLNGGPQMEEAKRSRLEQLISEILFWCLSNVFEPNVLNSVDQFDNIQRMFRLSIEMRDIWAFIRTDNFVQSWSCNEAVIKTIFGSKIRDESGSTIRNRELIRIVISRKTPILLTTKSMVLPIYPQHFFFFLG